MFFVSTTKAPTSLVGLTTCKPLFADFDVWIFFSYLPPRPCCPREEGGGWGCNWPSTPLPAHAPARESQPTSIFCLFGTNLPAILSLPTKFPGMLVRCVQLAVNHYYFVGGSDCWSRGRADRPAWWGEGSAEQAGGHAGVRHLPPPAHQSCYGQLWTQLLLAVRRYVVFCDLVHLTFIYITYC